VPLVALALARATGRSTRALVVVVLAITALGYALTPIRRPLLPLPDGWSGEQSPAILRLGRDDLYFSAFLGPRRAPYQDLVARIVRDGCTAVGLNFGTPSFEYPLWVLLAERAPEPVKIRNIDVTNPSRLLPPEFPDALCARITIPNPPQGTRQ
jgi:hypothetical protein